MTSIQIAEKITAKFHSPTFFTPSFDRGRLNVQPKDKTIQFDISNAPSELDKCDDNTTFFILDKIEDAAEILDILSGGEDFEACQKLVADFVATHNVNTKDVLYFIAYMTAQGRGE